MTHEYDPTCGGCVSGVDPFHKHNEHVHDVMGDGGEGGRCCECGDPAHCCCECPVFDLVAP